ncbi:MAG: DUF2231 domain-containing protein [Armatimonadota bacterium]|nr:hypothetical protein [bacterium]MDW8321536.1 DUF2231 domain-containing protein [Armatimonadota bacterium]
MYQIPILHPVLVHFPIAFILLAAVTALAWLSWGTRFWRHVTLLLLVAGFIGGLGAYFTGEAAEEFGKGNARVEMFEKQHENMALLTVVATGLALFTLAAYIGASRRLLPSDRPDEKDLPIARVVVAVLSIAAAVLVARTGHLGGLMVWGQPVGSVQEQATPQQTPESGEHRERE